MKQKWFSDMNFSEFKIIKTERACPLCYSKNTADKIYSFDPFHVLYCDTCDMSYLSPILGQKEITAIYSSDTYYSGGDFIGYSDYGLYEKAHSITYRSLLKKIQKMGITGGSLLEVGCGTGFFLKEAIKYFSYRAGLEMGRNSAKIASNWADEISIGPLEHYRGKRKFNLIVALQVIEHIPEPLKFLEMCMALLTKNGKLLISTPDMGSP
ncbi:MAG TPA: class I SAM-dependent methyltransferase [Deltaproteobacteria bacterium]|nr:class I SAM-dependent methyltransferase [Deltaproteobacteria bacterium]